MPRPRLFLLTVAGIENGLGCLPGDPAREVERVQIELVAFVAAQHDQPQ